MPGANEIVVIGAREHNLKNVSLTLPRDALVVLTGLSGSGKSSLAFDTIYAEGQRRYVESLSAYARQFLGQMDKPDVDSIEGLSPAISIDQKTTSRNPRSTVGTVTEIYDYLRLLWARIGVPHCHVCGERIAGQTIEQIADQVLELRGGDALHGAGAGRARPQGRVRQAARGAARGGLRARAARRRAAQPRRGASRSTSRSSTTIAVVVDRLVMRPDVRKRLVDSIETAAALAEGIVSVTMVERDGELGETLTFSEKFACLTCGTSMPELEPRIFSFNAPQGMCQHCTGLGAQLEIDPELVVPDPELSIAQGALAPWAASSSSYYDQMTAALAERYDIDVETPWRELDAAAARRLPLRDARRAGRGPLPQPLRARARLRGALRGDRRRTSSAATARPTPSSSARRSRST